MKIDYCLILAAGFGTRMGKIGEKLPKILWPIFEKSLIQLQIDYARKLGCQKIYINTHFGHEQILGHLESSNYLDDIIILHEKEILGAGGAIHNLAKRTEIDYKGNLLTLNADQFFFMSKEKLLTKISDLNNYSNILFGLKVGPATGYGKVEIENSIMKQIVPEDLDTEYYTYSGVGITRLDQLNHVYGVSRFFDTIANYKEKNVKMLTCPEVEYWDFGTLERYYNSMLGIVKSFEGSSSSNFIDFLIETGAIDKAKMYSSSYGTEVGENVIMLSSDYDTNLGHKNSIILDSKGLNSGINNSIFYQGISEEVLKMKVNY